MNWRLLRVAVLVGMVALVASAAGSAWMMHQSAPSEIAAPAASEANLVCLGMVDVEPGISRLGSDQPGRVAAILVKENEEVKAGMPLIRVDNWHQEAHLRQAQQALKAEQSKEEQARLAVSLHEQELAVQQSAIDAAAAKLTRAKARLASAKTKDINDVPPGRLLEYDDAVLDQESALRLEQGKLAILQKQIDLARQQVAQAGVGVAEREELVKQAVKAVADCELKAPMNGKVLRLRARLGELVGPTFPEPLVEFCPDLPRIVRAEVAQEFQSRVRLGAPCRITDNEDPLPQWRGKVVSTSDWFTRRRSILLEPMQFNDVRTLECLVEIDLSSAPPRIGQCVRVTLNSGN